MFLSFVPSLCMGAWRGCGRPVLRQDEREEHLRVQRQADAYSPEELGQILEKYGAKSKAGNTLTTPFPFNLMFKVYSILIVNLLYSILFTFVMLKACSIVYYTSIMFRVYSVVYCSRYTR